MLAALFRGVVARVLKMGSRKGGNKREDLEELQDVDRERLSVLADRAAIRSERHDRRGLWVAGIGVVATMLAPFLVPGLSMVVERWPSAAEETTAQQSSEAAVSEGEADDSSGGAPLPEGDDSPEPNGDGASSGTMSLAGCYETGVAVPCSSAHSSEVYQVGDGQGCDDHSLILYLGGLPGTDVLGPELAVAEAESEAGLCVITGATGLPRVTLEGIWRSDQNDDGYADGGQFRQCFTHQELPVSCDEDHVAETVYEGGAAGESEVDCAEKYEEFAGRPVDNDIRVRTYSLGRDLTCRVEVRGEGDVLSASVRALGDTALPLD